MLRLLKDFFLGMANMITSLVDIVISFVEDIVYVVKLCTTFVLKIPTLFSWLPSEAIAIIVIIFGVVVVYKIMGREG